MASLSFPILFVTSSRIGDAVLSSGLIKRLCDEIPHARFTVAAGPLTAPLFRDMPALDRLIVLEKKPGGRHWFDLWRRTRHRRWGLVVDLRGSRLSAFLRARRRAVFKPPPDTAEPAHKVFEAARVLKIEGEPPSPHLWTSAETDAKAAALLGEGGGPILAIGPGASWRGKAWPSERFARLAASLMEPGAPFADGRLLVLGDAADRAAGEAVRRSIKRDRVLDLVGKVDLLTAYAVLKRARLFVGNDSGLSHLAAAAGAPTLALFGPSDETLYGPWGPQARAIRGPRSFEAFRRADPQLNQPVCHMLDLPQAQVLEAARALLAETEGG